MTKAPIIALLTILAVNSSGLSAAPPSVHCKQPYTDPAPVGNLRSRWVSIEDYPARALRDGNEGIVRFRAYVSPIGRVESVEILQSDAGPTLEQATIMILRRKARFVPATRNCKPVSGEYEDIVKWDIPD